MRDTNQSIDGQTGNESVEQRFCELEDKIASVEEENEALKTENEQIKSLLEQQQESGLPNVTRRQALGGLLGGGALLGMGGAANAKSDDDGDPFADEGHDHSGDVLGKGKPVEAIQTGELNNAHYIEPDVDDWGAAVNDALREMEQGGVLFIPPARYNTETKAVIDKEIQLVGMGRGSNHTYTKSEPAIVKQADVPILEAAGATDSKHGRGVRCRIRGLRFETAVEDTTPGAIFHGTVEASNIVGENLGSHVILLQQAAGLDDNLNDSILQNISTKRGNGSVVRIENVSDAASNVNAMQIHVNNSFRNTGWGIDAADGFGNYYSVQVVHGAADGDTGGIRMNTSSSLAQITYMEGDVNTGIQFDGSNNTGILIRNGIGAAGFVDNTGKNRHINYGDVTNPDVTKPDVPYIIGGGNAEIVDPGKGLIVTTPDGLSQYLISVDNSGTLTTEQVSEFNIYNIGNISLSIDGDVAELADLPKRSLTDGFTVYKGDPTVSGSVWLAWDSSYLYLAADLTDNVHSQPNTSGKLYKGDSMQLGVAQGLPAEGPSFAEFTFALTSDGPQVVKRAMPSGPTKTVNIPSTIVRNDETNHTTYELAFPWNELPISPSDGRFSAGITVSDRDKDNTLSGLLEWGGGIFGEKDPADFNGIALDDN